MKKPHGRGKTVLITGASSGIGYELAKLFASDGYDLVLVAKNEPQLFHAVYFATKAYVLSFSEALTEELRGTGITVTTLCPGPTHTNFLKQAGIKSIESDQDITIASIEYKCWEKLFLPLINSCT